MFNAGCFTTLSVTQEYIASTGLAIVNNEMELMWKEAIVV
jgi:hypothetical protein